MLSVIQNTAIIPFMSRLHSTEATLDDSPAPVKTDNKKKKEEKEKVQQQNLFEASDPFFWWLSPWNLNQAGNQGHFKSTSTSSTLRDDGEFYKLKIELPGFSKNEVKVTLEDGDILCVNAQTNKAQKGEDGENERNVSFVRRFQLPTKLGDLKKAKSSLVNGILKVKLPKPEQNDPMPIPIPFDE